MEIIFKIFLTGLVLFICFVFGGGYYFFKSYGRKVDVVKVVSSVPVNVVPVSKVVDISVKLVGESSDYLYFQDVNKIIHKKKK